MADRQQGLQRCAQARQFLKSAKAMKGSKALVDKAIDMYQLVLQEHGQELSEPYFGLAYIAFAAGKPDLSLRFLQAGLRLAPDDQKMRQLLGRARRATEKQVQQRAIQAQSKVQTQVEEEAVAAGPPPNKIVSDLGSDSSGKLSRGPEVVMLQRVLQKMGHSVMVSGIFDRPTYAAVRALQSLYKLPVTGIVDAGTREQINPIVKVVLAELIALEQMLDIVTDYTHKQGQELSGFQKQMSTELLELLLSLVQDFPQEQEEAVEKPANTFLAREPLVSRLGNMGQMGIVSKGLEVQRLQQVLSRLDFPVKINAQFDLQTFSELSRFQLEHKFPVNGIVETATRQKLNEYLQVIFDEEAAEEAILEVVRLFQAELGLCFWPSIEAQRSDLTGLLMRLLKYGRLQDIPESIGHYFRLSQELGPSNRPGKVSQGREVRLLQQVLKKMGYDKVEINGGYDDSTYSAVRSFQISKKLAMTGVVDEKVREELNALILSLLSQSDEQI